MCVCACVCVCVAARVAQLHTTYRLKIALEDSYLVQQMQVKPASDASAQWAGVPGLL